MFIDLSVLIIIGLTLVSIVIILLFLVLVKHSHVLKSKQKDDYISMLIHDIRSPLTVIKGTADILLHESKNLSTEEKSNLLKQVQDTSDNLLTLVTDILDLSKMQTGKLTLNKASSDINMIVKMVTDTYLVVAKQSKINLHSNLNSSLPKVDIDQEKIKRVITNLISNAIKYTPEEGTINVSTDIKDDFIYISVTDTGLGVDDKMKEKLFNMFVQGKKTIKSSSTSSSGLGLNVSKNIVNLHGGRIWIEDNKPKGSKFIFTIPVNLPEF